jgi:hypothetical protein
LRKMSAMTGSSRSNSIFTLHMCLPRKLWLSKGNVRPCSRIEHQASSAFNLDHTLCDINEQVNRTDGFVIECVCTCFVCCLIACRLQLSVCLVLERPRFNEGSLDCRCRKNIELAPRYSVTDTRVCQQNVLPHALTAVKYCFDSCHEWARMLVCTIATKA